MEVFCEWNSDLVIEILLYLQPVHAAVPTPSSWGYDPKSDALSPTGFVGLRNMGCTCYMNGLLQVRLTEYPCSLFVFYFHFILGVIYGPKIPSNNFVN